MPQFTYDERTTVKQLTDTLRLVVKSAIAAYEHAAVRGLDSFGVGTISRRDLNFMAKSLDSDSQRKRKELCGYAILAFSEKNDCHAEPLAYGVEGEPHPELLLRRKRIECFDSREAAEAALKQTHDSESAAGSEWIKTFRFAVVKIVRTGAMVPA